jgi:hypothetical protein
LKTNQAIRAVKTTSKFSSKETVDALATFIAAINKSGANMPPLAIDPVSQAKSFLLKASVSVRLPLDKSRKNKIQLNPTPELRYRSPASIIGSTCLRSSLALGIPAAKRNAEANAHKGAEILICIACWLLVVGIFGFYPKYQLVPRMTRVLIGFQHNSCVPSANCHLLNQSTEMQS